MGDVSLVTLDTVRSCLNEETNCKSGNSKTKMLYSWRKFMVFVFMNN